MNLLDLACLILAVYCVVNIILRYGIRYRACLPPGPRGYPLIGNIFDWPPLESKAWETYAKWGQMYGACIHMRFWNLFYLGIPVLTLYFQGPICSINVFGQTTILLNDYSAVQQLLEAKGAIYSDRPHTAMMKLATMVDTTPLLLHDENLKLHRRVGSALSILRNPTGPRSVSFLPSALELPDWSRNCTRA